MTRFDWMSGWKMRQSGLTEISWRSCSVVMSKLPANISIMLGMKNYRECQLSQNLR